MTFQIIPFVISNSLKVMGFFYVATCDMTISR